MKYRSDFVTNSSDSSFVVDNIDNPLFDSFKNKLNIDPDSIEDVNDWLVPSIADSRSISEWQILKILFEEWNATLECYIEGDGEEVEDGSEYEDAILRSMAEEGFISLEPEESVVDWLDRAGLIELAESMEPLDEGIKSATIEVVRYGDGGWGPFEYVRINKGKRLNIYLDEDAIDYKDCLNENEPIQGKEFVLLEDEYDDRERIIEFIIKQGGTVSDEITDKTHYIICAEPDNQSAVLKAHDDCIPVLTEIGFWNRYSGESIEYDPWGDLYTEDISLLSWLEETGLGVVSMQIWKDGKWQFCDKY